jgi:hypothetical protein
MATEAVVLGPECPVVPAAYAVMAFDFFFYVSVAPRRVGVVSTQRWWHREAAWKVWLFVAYELWPRAETGVGNGTVVAEEDHIAFLFLASQSFPDVACEGFLADFEADYFIFIDIVGTSAFSVGVEKEVLYIWWHGGCGWLVIVAERSKGNGSVIAMVDWAASGIPCSMWLSDPCTTVWCLLRVARHAVNGRSKPRLAPYPSFPSPSPPTPFQTPHSQACLVPPLL